jgi:hypothetical protein
MFIVANWPSKEQEQIVADFKKGAGLAKAHRLMEQALCQQAVAGGCSLHANDTIRIGSDAKRKPVASTPTRQTIPSCSMTWPRYPIGEAHGRHAVCNSCLSCSEPAQPILNHFSYLY